MCETCSDRDRCRTYQLCAAATRYLSGSRHLTLTCGHHSLHAGDSSSALEALMKVWVERHLEFSGRLQVNLTAVALAAMLCDRSCPAIDQIQVPLARCHAVSSHCPLHATSYKLGCHGFVPTLAHHSK